MKTSNKLLIGLCFAITICMFIGMVVAKNNMTIYHEDEGRDAYTESKVLAESYNSNILNFNGGDYKIYTLDPTTTAISVTADKRNLDEVKIDDGDAVYFYRVGDQRIYKKMKLTIGTLGKDELVLNVKGHSKVYTAGAITGKLDMHVGYGSEVDLEYEGTELKLNAEHDALISLRGKATKAIIKNEDDSAVHGQEFYVYDLEVDLIDDAYVKLQGGGNVSGKVEDDSSLIFRDETYVNSLKQQDNALVQSKLKG